jgi:hypothetical protein
MSQIRIITDTHADEKPGKKKKAHRGYAFVVFEREKDMRGNYLPLALPFNDLFSHSSPSIPWVLPPKTYGPQACQSRGMNCETQKRALKLAQSPPSFFQLHPSLKSQATAKADFSMVSFTDTRAMVRFGE